MAPASDDGEVTPPAIRIAGLTGLPEVREGDDLVALVAAAVARLRLPIDDGDVFVVTQKIVSKAEGRVVRLDTVEPSPLARAWAERCGKVERLGVPTDEDHAVHSARFQRRRHDTAQHPSNEC